MSAEQLAFEGRVQALAHRVVVAVAIRAEYLALELELSDLLARRGDLITCLRRQTVASTAVDSVLLKPIWCVSAELLNPKATALALFTERMSSSACCRNSGG